MESLKKKACKNVLNHYTLPRECLDHLINQKIYKLEIGEYKGNCDALDLTLTLQTRTRLLHTDFDLCVFEMLKFFGTNYQKLNDFDEKKQEWVYFPDSQIRDTHTIFIEELQIGIPISVNKKIIYILTEVGKIQKITYESGNFFYEMDESFSYENEFLKNFNVTKFEKRFFKL